MKIKQFIEKAIKGGYNSEVRLGISKPDNKEWKDMIVSHGVECAILLDPKAWEAVGKVEGWKEWANEHHGQEDEWKTKMLNMTQALIDGKSIKEAKKTL